MVFDPTAEHIVERIRAWRSADDVFEPWLPAPRADGQPAWDSRVLGLALRAEGPLLRFDHPLLGPLLGRREVVDRYRMAKQAADAAERRALAAEQEIGVLQAELRHLRGGL